MQDPHHREDIEEGRSSFECERDDKQEHDTEIESYLKDRFSVMIIDKIRNRPKKEIECD